MSPVSIKYGPRTKFHQWLRRQTAEATAIPQEIIELPEKVENLLTSLRNLERKTLSPDLERIIGIGKKREEVMKSMGIQNIHALAQLPDEAVGALYEKLAKLKTSKDDIKDWIFDAKILRIIITPPE
jgi:predicted flap endonuclease-1-like 5' DNA nuclease